MLTSTLRVVKQIDSNHNLMNNQTVVYYWLLSTSCWYLVLQYLATYLHRWRQVLFIYFTPRPPRYSQSHLSYSSWVHCQEKTSTYQSQLMSYSRGEGGWGASVEKQYKATTNVQRPKSNPGGACHSVMTDVSVSVDIGGSFVLCVVVYEQHTLHAVYVSCQNTWLLILGDETIWSLCIL